MRVHNWPIKLALAISEARTKEFKYGDFDCMLFAADIVKAMTGVDYAERFRGRYDSEKGAYEIIEEYGTPVDLLTAVIGSPPIHPAQAMRGDVVLAELPLPTAGVCMGVACAFPTAKGLRFLPRSVITHAWRIQ